MIEEIIKKDALVKIYPMRGETETGRIFVSEGQKSGRGTIRKFLSEKEIEIQMEEEIPLEKKVCYAIYILSYEKVYLTYVYYHSSWFEEGKNMVSMEIISPMERVQRRKHQRVSCHAKLAFRQISQEDVTGEEIYNEKLPGFSPREFEDSMVDISGGGIRFTSKREVRQEDYLFVAFEMELDSQRIAVSMPGQVVYAAKLRNEKDYYDIRMKYLRIPEKLREQIIHFVFQLERND